MKKTVKTTGKGMPLRAPCTKCSKLISRGYGSFLSGTFLCPECVKASPKHLARLDPEARKELLGDSAQK